jgi:hypothetical protein
MLIKVRRGLVRAGRVIVGEVSWRVKREDEGVFNVYGSDFRLAGCIRYLFWRDHAFLETGSHKVEISFHSRESSFVFNGATFRLGSMNEGRIVIRERDRVVMEGRVTPGGVRLEAVAMDLEPIQRELAFCLALRSEDLYRQFHPPERRMEPSP